MSDFTTYREVVPYLSYQGFLGAAAPGKCGSLRLSFELDAAGRSVLRRLERHAPLIVQQALYFDEAMPQMPCVYILSAGGPMVDGDRYSQHFRLARGSMAHVATGAATKVAEMRTNFASMEQRFVLADGCYMEYLPEPLIPCRHARYVASTVAVVAPTATLVYAETYAPGRRHYGAGECFDYDVLSVALRAERPDGRLLFREKMVIAPALTPPAVVGRMGAGEAFASIVILTPPEAAAAIRERLAPGGDSTSGAASGTAQLPGGAGLLVRVLGGNTAGVKRMVRRVCSTVREVVKGHPLPPEFPWR